MSMGNEQFQSEEEAFAGAPQGFDAAESPEQQPQAPAPSATPEPFEGFSQLPESARAKFTETWEKAQKFEQELAQQRRQYGALSGRVPALQRELDALKKRTAAAPSSAPSPQTMSAEQWEKFKAQWPEDAAGIEQALARQAAEIGGKLTPLEKQLQEQAAKLERFEQMAQEAENEAIQETLDDEVPDWRIIAGWETADGQAGDQSWHPEFQAWLDSMPGRIRAQYDELLGSRDGSDIAYVLNMFKRDYIDLLEQEGASAPPQPQVRRNVDVMPSATGNSLGSSSRGGFQSAEEQAYVAATTGDLMQRWRQARTG
jgi:hypothetical protein